MSKNIIANGRAHQAHCGRASKANTSRYHAAIKALSALFFAKSPKMNGPWCQLLTERKAHWGHTYVLKGSQETRFAFKKFAEAEGIMGAGQWALLVRGDDQYLIITMPKAKTKGSHEHHVKEVLLGLPGGHTLEWIQPFSRRWQSLFGWIPKPEAELREGLLELSTGQFPAIEDCRHWSWETPRSEGSRESNPRENERVSALWQEHPYVQISGPCANGNPRVIDATKGLRMHEGPYTQCKLCRKVLCLGCARQNDLVRTKSGKQYDRTDLEEALVPKPEVKNEKDRFWHHPTNSQPFWVIPIKKMAMTEKLAWIRQELEDEGIGPFCAKFRELLGHEYSQVNDKSIKKAALELYAMHTNRKLEKSVEMLTASELEAFSRVWNERAPARCAGCKADVFEAPLIHACDIFCTKCTNLQKTAVCRKCKGPADRDSIPACAACAKGPVLPGKPSKRASKRLINVVHINTQQLVKNRKFWGKPDFDLAPAAKKPRRRA